jgi:hypothetical protein
MLPIWPGNPAIYVNVPTYEIASLFERLASAMERQENEVASSLNKAMSAERKPKRHDVDERYPFA